MPWPWQLFLRLFFVFFWGGTRISRIFTDECFPVWIFQQIQCESVKSVSPFPPLPIGDFIRVYQYAFAVRAFCVFPGSLFLLLGRPCWPSAISLESWGLCSQG